MENPSFNGCSNPAARTGRREVTAKDREILFGREPIIAPKVVALTASTQRGAEPKPDAWEAGAWLPGRQKRDYQARSFLRARCEPHPRLAR
jgi:hypothetical protein